MDIRIKPVRSLQGEIQVPGDKSISHRSVMLGALACGETEIENFLFGEDCLSSIRVIRDLGVKVITEKNRVIVQSEGMDALSEPENILDVGNSGTTIRLMTGILSGCSFFSVLNGDASIRRRPMQRVVNPLTTMGAKIMARNVDGYTPMAIRGGDLKAIEYASPVASAQVKSAIMLAGLFADGQTTIIEPTQSRDHTERMLRYLGARLEVNHRRITVWGRPNLKGRKISVPGDISSAMFFLVAGLVVPDTDLTIYNVGVNPTRTGALEILKKMGADIVLMNEQEINGEPVADIRVRSSNLVGTTIGGDSIPYLIDEIPVLAVAAAMADGETVVQDAVELRHKETDRIIAIVKTLQKLGAEIKEHPDGFTIRGGQLLRGAVCDSYGDHRMAMTATVAGLVAQGETIIEGAGCVNISYPNFFDTLDSIVVK